MLNWLTGVNSARAMVYLPADAGHTPEPAMARLRAQGLGGIDLGRQAGATAGEGWRIQVDDSDWGAATIEHVLDPPDPELAIRYAANLTERDKARVVTPYSALVVTVPARTKRVLADRKSLLRYAASVMGDSGLVALDLQSRLPWTREALADELAHDADLDIEALYTLEHVYEADGSGGRTVTWAHTHGLSDVGAFDIDVVAPHPDFVDRGHQAFRTIAELALAGTVSIDSETFVFGEPGGVARPVRAGDFMRDADPRWRELRGGGHDEEDGRAVLCDPVPGGLTKLLGRGSAPVPMSFARRPIPERFRSRVPNEFSSLMAERAARTVRLLRRYRDEFASFEPVTLIKLGYPTRKGGDDREHMWFEVHEMGDDWVEATLGNRPYDVEMREGDRGRHSLELLSDWVLLTPAGQISPRSSHVARMLREMPPAG